MKLASDFRRLALDALQGNWRVAILTGFVASLMGASLWGGGGSSGSSGSSDSGSAGDLFHLQFVQFVLLHIVHHNEFSFSFFFRLLTTAQTTLRTVCMPSCFFLLIERCGNKSRPQL